MKQIHMKNVQRFYKYIILFITGTCFCIAAVEKPLNILVLYADDWRYDTLGIDGHAVVQTPNLNRLAETGIRFSHKYVTTAICGVSRASLYTGQWMARHGNRGFDAFKTPWAQTYPGLLRDNGYYVGHVGKWHNGKFPAERFDFGRAYSGTHWMKQGDGTKIHVTQRNENDAMEFLRTRPEDQPFSLTVAFFAPHAEDQHPKQFLPQLESLELYKDVEIPVPSNATDASFNRLPPFLTTETNEGRIRWHWRFDTPDKYQTMMKNYYRLITEIDATCGRILQELEAQGILENTLVIFTTDNGYYHAEHGLADKWYPHEESIRVPLIINDPRMPKGKAGKLDNHMVLNVDLAPTILNAAEIPPPLSMQGEDLGPLYLGGPTPEWRTDFFYEHPIISNIERIPSSEALVTKDWKYFYWPDFEYEQLFDLRTDPQEEKDLARDLEHRAQLQQMKERFLTLKADAR
jgi:arylsulfatase A-like enzyme